MYQNDIEEPKQPKKKFNIYNWYYKNGKDNNKGSLLFYSLRFFSAILQCS